MAEARFMGPGTGALDELECMPVPAVGEKKRLEGLGVCEGRRGVGEPRERCFSEIGWLEDS